MEDWKRIPTFPDYEICKDGRIRNKNTGKYIRINWYNGVAFVFLSYKGKVYTRSVRKLLSIVHGLKVLCRVPKVAKCPNCGLITGSRQMEEHLLGCTARDPNTEYFEF